MNDTSGDEHPFRLAAQLSNFGEIAAEREFRPEFFVQSDSWEAVRSRDRCIVVGRKGTGKTALGLALFDERLRDPRVFARKLNFADYPWAVHDLVRDTTVGRSTRFVETWLFLILVELAKFAIEDQGGNHSERRSAACGELDGFVNEIWGATSFDFRQMFTPAQFRITKSFKPSAAGFSVGGVDWEKISRETLGPKLREMNRWLQTVLVDALEANTEYFLIFDDLDIDMDPSSELYIDSMIGLVRAAGAVDLWAREHGAEACAVVLMRNDLYGLLQFPDKTKFEDALVERLTWTDESTGPDSLRQILNARIPVLAEAAGLEELEGVEDWWSEMFSDSDVEPGMGIFEFLVERSYRRPRDLIKFCNLCIERTQQRLAMEGEGRIEPEDVVNALPAYSAYVREEIRAESFSHFEDMNLWLELLGRIGSASFTRKEFEAQAEQSEDLVGGTSAAKILQAFFRFSIIGCARAKSKTAAQRDYFWAHDETPRAFNINAPVFLVHPGLQSTLGLDA